VFWVDGIMTVMTHCPDVLRDRRGHGTIRGSAKEVVAILGEVLKGIHGRVLDRRRASVDGCVEGSSDGLSRCQVCCIGGMAGEVHRV
jgi:hypothetical protein